MRYGFITDIHANLEALEAACAFLQEQRVNEVICLGDIVGCGANPDECVSFIKANEIAAVAGNHDWAVCGKRSLDFFDAQGQEIILWTRDQISAANIAYLQDLPLVVDAEDFSAVHATLNDAARFLSAEGYDDYAETFISMTYPLCFVGHTHEPYILSYCDGRIDRSGDLVVCEPGQKYLVNAGSVGQPRDGNPDASVVIYDSKTQTVHIKRVCYDVQRAQKKIIRAGLPRRLSERLALGR